jgi:hypothetical protein
MESHLNAYRREKNWDKSDETETKISITDGRRAGGRVECRREKN